MSLRESARHSRSERVQKSETSTGVSGVKNQEMVCRRLGFFVQCSRVPLSLSLQEVLLTENNFRMLWSTANPEWERSQDVVISATTTLTTQLCLRIILLPVLFLPQRSVQKQSAGIQQHGLGFKEQLAFLQRACPSMYSCRRLQNSCYSRNLLSDSRRL